MANIAVGFVRNRAGVYDDYAGAVGSGRNCGSGVEEFILNCSAFGLGSASTEVCDV